MRAQQRADTGRPSPRPLCLVAKSCPTLCHGLSPPGSSSMGILQARILEWVACPPPGNGPKPGIETWCHALQVDSYRLSPREAHSGGNRLVHTGKRSKTAAPEAWARVGKLSFIGCRRGSGRSHHGAQRVFSCPWINFRSGPQDRSRGSSYL